MEPPQRPSTSRPLSGSRQQKRPRVAEENRQRATKACNECRRLKEKCEGGLPCARCVRTKRICAFDRNATAGHVNRSIPSSTVDGNDAERTKYLEQIARHFLGDVPMTLSNLKSISESFKRDDTRAEAESAEFDLNELEDLKLEDETFTVKGLSQNTAHYSGEFSHWNFSQRVQKRVDKFSDGGADNPKGVIEYWRATQLQSPESTIFAVLDALPPRPVVEFLVRIYFQYAQTNSFYIEESWLRCKLDILYERPTNISSSDSGWVCGILMVFAIGSQFAHMEAGSPNNFETLDISSGNGISGEQEVGVAIYHVASKLIPDVIAIASLESVQACLLLAHYALPLDAHGLAYTYLGLAIKMAIQNGMHRKYAGQDFDDLTVEIRNRLWWTAYTLERRICILHGRPLSVSPNDVDADLPADLPELRAPSQPSQFANMSALIFLINKLGDIAHAIILLRKCPKRLQPTYFERIFEIRQELRTWWSTLPSSISCRDLSPLSPLFRHNAHLTLCFHLNEIYMGRPFIFSDSKTSSPGFDRSPSAQAQSSISRTRSRAMLVSDAIMAALEVIKLCQLLQENCGLARASYTEFTSCRAALLVILAQSLNERTENLKASLASGLRLIKGMAVYIDSAKSDVSMIEALEKAIKRLEIRNNKISQGQDNETGYDQFKNWAIRWKSEQAEKSGSGAPLPQQPTDVVGSDNWDGFGLDFHENGASTDSLFQFDSQMSGIGLGDILTPFQSQAESGEIPDDQWQTSFSDLDSFGMGSEFSGWS